MITNKSGDILGFSSSPKQISTLATKVTTLLQDYKRGDIVITLAVLWLMVCERFNVNPTDMMSVASRMRTETYDSKHTLNFRALKDYMEHEL